MDWSINFRLPIDHDTVARCLTVTSWQEGPWFDSHLGRWSVLRPCCVELTSCRHAYKWILAMVLIQWTYRTDPIVPGQDMDEHLDLAPCCLDIHIWLTTAPDCPCSKENWRGIIKSVSVCVTTELWLKVSPSDHCICIITIPEHLLNIVLRSLQVESYKNVVNYLIFIEGSTQDGIQMD